MAAEITHEKEGVNILTLWEEYCRVVESAEDARLGRERDTAYARLVAVIGGVSSLEQVRALQAFYMYILSIEKGCDPEMLGVKYRAADLGVVIRERLELIENSVRVDISGIVQESAEITDEEKKWLSAMEAGIDLISPLKARRGKRSGLFEYNEEMRKLERMLGFRKEASVSGVTDGGKQYDGGKGAVSEEDFSEIVWELLALMKKFLFDGDMLIYPVMLSETLYGYIADVWRARGYNIQLLEEGFSLQTAENNNKLALELFLRKKKVTLFTLESLWREIKIYRKGDESLRAKDSVLSELLNELRRSGIVLRDRRFVVLNSRSDNHGFKHILARHAEEFAAWGINSPEEIAAVIMEVVQKGRVLEEGKLSFVIESPKGSLTVRVIISIYGDEVTTAYPVKKKPNSAGGRHPTGLQRDQRLSVMSKKLQPLPPWEQKKIIALISGGVVNKRYWEEIASGCCEVMQGGRSMIPGTPMSPIVAFSQTLIGPGLEKLNITNTDIRENRSSFLNSVLSRYRAMYVKANGNTPEAEKTGERLSRAMEYLLYIAGGYRLNIPRRELMGVLEEAARISNCRVEDMILPGNQPGTSIIGEKGLKALEMLFNPGIDYLQQDKDGGEYTEGDIFLDWDHLEKPPISEELYFYLSDKGTTIMREQVTEKLDNSIVKAAGLQRHVLFHLRDENRQAVRLSVFLKLLKALYGETPDNIRRIKDQIYVEIEALSAGRATGRVEIAGLSGERKFPIRFSAGLLFWLGFVVSAFTYSGSKKADVRLRLTQRKEVKGEKRLGRRFAVSSFKKLHYEIWACASEEKIQSVQSDFLIPLVIINMLSAVHKIDFGNPESVLEFAGKCDNPLREAFASGCSTGLIETNKVEHKKKIEELLNIYGFVPLPEDQSRPVEKKEPVKEKNTISSDKQQKQGSGTKERGKRVKPRRTTGKTVKGRAKPALKLLSQSSANRDPRSEVKSRAGMGAQTVIEAQISPTSSSLEKTVKKQAKPALKLPSQSSAIQAAGQPSHGSSIQKQKLSPFMKIILDLMWFYQVHPGIVEKVDYERDTLEQVIRYFEGAAVGREEVFLSLKKYIREEKRSFREIGEQTFSRDNFLKFIVTFIQASHLSLRDCQKEGLKLLYLFKAPVEFKGSDFLLDPQVCEFFGLGSFAITMRSRRPNDIKVTVIGGGDQKLFSALFGKELVDEFKADGGGKETKGLLLPITSTDMQKVITNVVSYNYIRSEWKKHCRIIRALEKYYADSGKITGPPVVLWYDPAAKNIRSKPFLIFFTNEEKSFLTAPPHNFKDSEIEETEYFILHLSSLTRELNLPVYTGETILAWGYRFEMFDRFRETYFGEVMLSRMTGTKKNDFIHEYVDKMSAVAETMRGYEKSLVSSRLNAVFDETISKLIEDSRHGAISELVFEILKDAPFSQIRNLKVLRNAINLFLLNEAWAREDVIKNARYETISENRLSMLIRNIKSVRILKRILIQNESRIRGNRRFFLHGDIEEFISHGMSSLCCSMGVFKTEFLLDNHPDRLLKLSDDEKAAMELYLNDLADVLLTLNQYLGISVALLKFSAPARNKFCVIDNRKRILPKALLDSLEGFDGGKQKEVRTSDIRTELSQISSVLRHDQNDPEARKPLVEEIVLKALEESSGEQRENMGIPKGTNPGALKDGIRQLAEADRLWIWLTKVSQRELLVKVFAGLMKISEDESREIIRGLTEKYRPGELEKTLREKVKLYAADGGTEHSGVFGNVPQELYIAAALWLKVRVFVDTWTPITQKRKLLLHLARIEAESGRIDEAEGLFRKAEDLVIYDRNKPNLSGDDGVDDVFEALLESGRGDRSGRLFILAFDILERDRRKFFDPSHCFSVFFQRLMTVSGISIKEKDALFKRALSVAETTEENPHYQYYALSWLSWKLTEPGLRADKENALKEFLLRLGTPCDQFDKVRFYCQTAAVLIRAGWEKEALEFFKTSLEAIEALPDGAKGHLAFQSVNHIIDELKESARIEETRGLIDQSFAGMNTYLKKGDYYRFTLLTGFVPLFARSGQYDQAVSCLEEAVDIWKKFINPQKEMADLLVAWQALAGIPGAEKSTRRILEVSNSRQNVESRISTLIVMTEKLVKSGKKDEADKLFAEARRQFNELSLGSDNIGLFFKMGVVMCACGMADKGGWLMQDAIRMSRFSREYLSHILRILDESESLPDKTGLYLSIVDTLCPEKDMANATDTILYILNVLKKSPSLDPAGKIMEEILYLTDWRMPKDFSLRRSRILIALADLLGYWPNKEAAISILDRLPYAVERSSEIRRDEILVSIVEAKLQIGKTDERGILFQEAAGLAERIVGDDAKLSV
ncbi:MAG: hypothetical protein WC329_05840, partial [Candidatus Omnitrophota bacterium]